MIEKPLHVIVLAAGKGSRMRSSMPKVLHQVAGKSLLGHVVDTALKLNPAKVHIVVGHGKQQLIDSLSEHPDNALLNWVEQAQQLGTGHAVAQALPNIDADANVLMLTADVPLIQADTLTGMVDAMISSPLVLLTAMMDQPYGLGRITRDDGDAVTGIVEEKDANPAQRQIREINSGIMCAHRDLLGDWLSQVSNDNAQQEYYLTDIVQLASKSGNPIATLQPDQNSEVMGINSRAQLATVERTYQKHQVERLMHAGVTVIDPARVDIRGEVSIGEDTVLDINVVIEGPTTIGRNTRIAPNCVITASLLADNVTVHPNTVIDQAVLAEGTNVGPFARLRPGTKLGPNVRIGNFVETKNAQLDAGAKVNHLSYVGDATVGANTNIGAGVITCNYDGANKFHTTIGNNVFVGSDSQLIAPITVGDGATIGAGSTITNNVPADKLVINRGRQKQIDDWQRPTKQDKK